MPKAQSAFSGHSSPRSDALDVNAPRGGGEDVDLKQRSTPFMAAASEPTAAIMLLVALLARQAAHEACAEDTTQKGQIDGA